MAKAHVFNFHELRFSPAQSRGPTQPPSFAPSVLVGIFSAFQGGLACLGSFLTQGSHFGGLPHPETTFSAQDGHESLRPWLLGLDLVRSPAAIQTRVPTPFPVSASFSFDLDCIRNFKQ